MARILIVTALALSLAAAASARAPGPRCFGAASSDPLHHCHNSGLDHRVTPSPADAVLQVDRRPCTPVEGPARACWFGTPPGQGARTVALVGDSHAEHWRPALDRVAAGLHWTIYMVTRSGCHFTRAVPAAPQARDVCLAYNRDALTWLGRHPEVSAIIASDHPSGVVRRAGESMMSAWVRGIEEQWAAMPASVEHVLAIRDVPFIDAGTLPCVQRAMRSRRNAGRACRIARNRAVHHDPGPVAARRVGPARAAVIDLTGFFCGRRWCPPVIGGVLVYADFFDHITVSYGRTLGPYLLRGIRRATAAW